MRWRLAMMAALAMATSACGVPSMTASADREQEARTLVEDLAMDRDEALIAKASSKVDPAQLRAQLPFMKSIVPDGPVPEGQTQGWSANAGTGGTTYALSRTYDYPDRTLTAETTFIKEGETWKWLGFNVAPTMKAAPEEPVVVVAPPETPAG